ncbi:MAG: undecaprenyl/decaprenyl-phosphate alpha-N-acetylglucosaminyl 1-phosphate transferase [Chloroflexi bacterium]|nr:undecaprenyl/decaprenyl-phosphate alpha-N-acetylglucosaminyl 1-phosphate transferase [Chloroflexota bacterium]
MTLALPMVLAFVISFLLCYLLTPVIRQWALRLGFRDRPSSRRQETLKPRLGGVALYLAFMVALGVTAPLVAGRTADEVRKLIAIWGGATVALTIGIIDDKRELRAFPQLVGQLTAGGIAMAGGMIIYEVTNPFGTTLYQSMFHLPTVLALAFTLFWIVGAMNIINFIDGLDGLAAGIAAIAAAVLFVQTLRMNQYTLAVLPLALMGATLGFLPHNFFPSKITMGTSGALFLGFVLSTLSVVGGTKAATFLLVLGVPIVDGAWIIFRRLKMGRSPFAADRSHLHHRLMEMGLSPTKIVFLFYVLCALFGSLALLLATRLAKLYLFAGMSLTLTVFLALLAQKSLVKKD